MIARTFTLAKIPFIAITSRGDKRLFFSRYCRQRFEVPSPEKKPEAFFQQLKEIVNEIGEGHPLFVSNDGHLDVLLKHWDEMRKMFRLTTIDRELLETILNKDQFSEYARIHQLPVPPIYSAEELKKNHNHTFPLMIKPIVRLNWFDSDTVQGAAGKSYKGLLINNQDELQKYQTSLDKENIHYVVQRFVAGPESNIVSFHSFYTEDSKPLGYFVGRKIRTYPSEYGQSCALKLIEDPYVVEKSLEILEKMHYKGPVKIDYKIDENTNEYFLLELNPTRYNIWHYLGARAGVNLPAIAFEYMNGQTERRPVVNRWQTNLRWFNFVNDFQSFLELRKDGTLSFFDWLRSYRGKRIYQTLAFDDLKPVFYGIYLTFRGLLRKILK